MLLFILFFLEVLAQSSTPVSQLSTAQLSAEIPSTEKAAKYSKDEAQRLTWSAWDLGDRIKKKTGMKNSVYDLYQLLTKDAKSEKEKIAIGEHISKCLANSLKGDSCPDVLKPLQLDSESPKRSTILPEAMGLKRAIDDLVQAEKQKINQERYTDRLSEMRDALSHKTAEASAACKAYLERMKDKIKLPSGGSFPVAGDAQAMLTSFRTRYQEVHSQTLDRKEKINATMQLRQMAEVLRCNNQRTAVKNEIKKLDEELKKGFIEGHDTCAEVEKVEENENAVLGCIAGFLDTLPSAHNEGISYAEQHLKHVEGITVDTVLNDVAHKTIDQALNNLAELNTKYTLGLDTDTHAASNLTPMQLSVKAAIGGDGPFSDYAIKKAHTHAPGVTPVNPCSSGRLDKLTENIHREFAQISSLYNKEMVSRAGHGVTFQPDRLPKAQDQMSFLQSKLSDIVAQNIAKDPDMGAFTYTNEFMNQFQIEPAHGTCGGAVGLCSGTAEAKLEFEKASCNDLKVGLRNAALQNIKAVANPGFASGRAKSYAEWSFDHLTRDGNKKIAMGRFQEFMTSEKINDLRSDDDLDDLAEEIFSELPQLRTTDPEKKKKITHIKMLLNSNPESLPELLRTYQGNARLICLLAKSAKKDNMLQPVIDQEMKLLKGIAKTAGIAASTAGFFVNPAIGFALATASFGAAEFNNWMQYDNMKGKLAQALANRQGTMDQCMNGLRGMHAGGDESHFRLQCEEALETIKTAHELEEELHHVVSGATQEVLLYAAYLAPLATHVSHGWHDFKEGFKGFSQLEGSIGSKLGETLKKSFIDSHVIDHGVFGELMHQFDKVNDLTGIAKVGQQSYVASKVAKMMYYSKYLPATAYPLIAGPRKALVMIELEESIEAFKKANGKLPTPQQAEHMQHEIYDRLKGYTEEQFQKHEARVIAHN